MRRQGLAADVFIMQQQRRHRRRQAGQHGRHRQPRGGDDLRPGRVIVMAGMNKVAADLDAAIARVTQHRRPGQQPARRRRYALLPYRLLPGPALPSPAPHLLPARGHRGQHDPRPRHRGPGRRVPGVLRRIMAARHRELHVRHMTPADIDFAIALHPRGRLGQREPGCVRGVPGPRRRAAASSPRPAEERAGVCVATKYRDNGFIGELVVSRHMRILGARPLLFQKALAPTGRPGIENIFLDGDLNAVSYYEIDGLQQDLPVAALPGTNQGQNPCRRPPAAARATWTGCARSDRELFGDDRGFFLRRCAALLPGLGLVRESDDAHQRLDHGPARRRAAGGRPLGGTRRPGRTAAPLLEHLASENGTGVFPHRRPGKQ